MKQLHVLCYAVVFVAFVGGRQQGDWRDSEFSHRLSQIFTNCFKKFMEVHDGRPIPNFCLQTKPFNRAKFVMNFTCGLIGIHPYWSSALPCMFSSFKNLLRAMVRKTGQKKIGSALKSSAEHQEAHIGSLHFKLITNEQFCHSIT